MSELKCVDDILLEFQSRRPLRTGSLIITIFGDSLSQHGGEVWLGSLIEVLQPFGMNQRLVRTSVYRLIKENWLQSHQIGRKSYYRFTEFGLRQYQKTERRIYAASKPKWDGTWTLVFPVNVVDEDREELRRELCWLGFGALTTGVLAIPSGDRRALDETLDELKLADKVVVMKASPEDEISGTVLKDLSWRCWDVVQLQERYEAFLEKFEPVHQFIQNGGHLSPEQSFQVRTLLIHEYRRILLKDTDLPDALLSETWAGNRAKDLTAELYKLTYKTTEAFLTEHMETRHGKLPAFSDGFLERFGGLA